MCLLIFFHIYVYILYTLYNIAQAFWIHMNIFHIVFLRLTTKRRLQKKSKCSSRSASPWVTWSKHHGPGCRGCSSPAAGQRSASQEGTWQTGRSPWRGCTSERQTCFLGHWSQCTIIIIDIIIIRSSSAIIIIINLLLGTLIPMALSKHFMAAPTAVSNW